MTILTSVWRAQHPNTGQNIQQGLEEQFKKIASKLLFWRQTYSFFSSDNLILAIYSENTFKANTCTTYSFVLRGWTSLKLSTSVLDKILTRDQAVWSIQKERGL